MSGQEEQALITESRCGDPARETKAEEKLIIANLRLVASLARRHQHGLPLEDLISEGTLGLRVAIQKFNPAMGARLSTYAIWWIKHHLRKALNESKTIRVPIHQQHHVKRIQDTILRLTEATGSPPTDEEIAAETGLKTHVVQNLRDLSSPMLSLQNSPHHETDGRTFEETLKDQNASGLTPFEHLKSKHAKETLERILQSRLNAQEQNVIRLRFGLDEGGPKTLDETGEALGLTRERIRQIQNLALKKLKESLLAHQNMESTLAYYNGCPPKT
jgi:RNA polymerase primary sigma factor